MKNHQHNQFENLKEQVLAKINTNKVVMRSRLYFAVRVVSLVALICIVLLLSIFTVSLLFFSLRVSSHLLLLGFGLRGLTTFLSLFPWIPLALTIGALVLVVKLFRKFGAGYRMPVLYILGFTLLFSVGAGLALDRETRFNDRMFMRAEHKELPAPFGSVYTQARRLPAPEDGICKCKIVAIGDEMLTVMDTKFGAKRVFLVPVPENEETLVVGDEIFIVGDQIGGVFKPLNVHRVPERQRMFFPE